MLGVPKRQNGKLLLFVMGKKHIVVLLFVRLKASKRRRHIVLILTGLGTPKQSARTVLWDLVKRVNTDTDWPDFFY